MPLRVNGLTTGSVTLAAPDNGGNTTLTLPSGTGTNGQLISTNGSGVLSFVNGGKILQVVEQTSTSVVTNSSTNYTTLLTATITPTSTSNKVLALASVSVASTASTNAYCGVRIHRGSALIENYAGINGASTNTAQFGLVRLDSPSSTSSLSYTLDMAKGSGGTTSCATDGRYTLILMEVGG